MHQHKSCGKEQRAWLPLPNGSVAPHPWCVKCGVVRNLTDDRAKKLGYWMNMMAEIANSYKISKAQRRLAAMELQSHDGFDDAYSMTGEAQKRIFASIIKKYFGINESITYSFIR
ncbi:MAG: hypothetical protein FE044_02315 [Thermoplasmata archaeon]|nr:MAG: hypothetical protein FE044_02315 [Thermoplasmata archaeon]